MCTICLSSLSITILGKDLPAGVAYYVNQSGSSVNFEVVQPTNPIPSNLRFNFCKGSFGITITSANRQHNISEQIWNMTSCNFNNGQAQIDVDVNKFPGTKAGENYTVVFNISFHFDGVADVCYLQLEVDNVVLNKGEQ